MRKYMVNDLTARFASFAVGENLILPGDRLLAAHSGGSDSTFLFEMLLRNMERLGFEFEAGHVNHGLRGEAADADEEFVRRRCFEEGIPFRRAEVSVGELQDTEGLSVEMAARRLRYNVLEGMALQAGCNKVAFAHQADDRIETFLVRLLRSAGPDSLASIPLRRPMGKIELIRPLFAFRRAEIMEWLGAEGIEFRTDESNLDRSITRNAVRQELIPLLEERFNPSLGDTILRVIDALERDSVFINRLAAEEGKGRFIDAERGRLINLKGMAEEDTPLIIRLMLMTATDLAGEEYRLGYDHLMGAVNLWLTGKRNDRLDFPEGWGIVRTPEGILFRETPEFKPPPEISSGPDIDERPIINEGEVNLPETFRLVGKMRPIEDIPDLKHPPPDTVYINTILAGHLRVDYCRTGRDIRPLGMGGHTKKVSDVLMEAGVPKHLREWVPVLIDEGEANNVLAIPHLGLMAESAKVKPADSHLLEIRAIPPLEEGLS